MDKIQYKDPYSFSYNLDHLKEQEIKDFKLKIKSGENVIEEKIIPKSEWRKKDGNTTGFFTKDIPFNSDKYYTMEVYIEYLIVEQGKKKIQKEKINFKVKVREETGVKIWWRMSSV